MLPSGATRRPGRTALVVLQLLVFVTYIFGPTATLAEDPTPEPSPTEAAAPEATPDPTPEPTAEPAPEATPAPTPAATPEPTPEATSEATPDATPEPTPTPTPAGEPVPYLITFAPGTSAARQLQILDATGATDVEAIPQLAVRSITLDANSVSAQLSSLIAAPEVLRIEADRVRDAGAAPTDSSYADQWSLPQIGWDELYGSAAIAGTATVAILDTGVQANHPDLDGVVLPGWSALPGANPLTDPNGHGTWMAGIVAAETDNGFGVAGTAYAGVSVLPITVLGADGTGQDSDIIAGVVHAADADADVILMAFSNPGFSGALQAAIDYAWASGSVLVAATGNDGVSTATFPAGDRGVIGVTSTDASDAVAASANRGPAAFMAAPGVDILTTASFDPATAQPGDEVVSISGTSAAAASVAGAAALLAANEPELSNGVVVSRLARTADAAGDPADTGNGRLNLLRAMSDASTDAVQPAGAAPVGDGGPLVGPYVAAASRFSGTVTPSSVSGGSTNNYTFTLTAANGSAGATVSLTVPAGWTAPTAGLGGNVTLGAGTCAVTNLTVSVMTISVSQPSGGGCNNNTTVILNYSNAVAPNPSVSTDYTFAVSPRQSNDAQPVVTVTANANTAPTANSQTVSTLEDTAKLITLTGSDPQNDALTFKITSLPANAKLYNGNSTAAADEITSASLASPFTLPGATVTYLPNANYNNTAGTPDTFRFIVSDASLSSAEATVSVTVTPVNDEPTLTAITDRTILEDAGAQTVNLSGITSGPANESAQTLSVTATSSNTGLIPDPTVTYTSPNTTGSLSFTPVANQFGTATITVTVMDNGGTANSGDDNIVRTFLVTVTPVNDEPTLTAITDRTILEDAGAQTVNLSGITSGPANESAQTLSVTATSSNTGLIPDPTVTYTSPNTTGSLSFTPVANQFGTATITVTVMDNGGTANSGDDNIVRTFLVTVTPVNDRPVIDLNGDGVGNEGIDNAASFTEDGGSVTLAPDALVTDIDNTNLTSAQVQLTNDPDDADESLAVSGSCAVGISIGAYNSGTGVLALSGSSSLANYQACLRLVTYNNTDQDPSSANRLIRWTVFDGDSVNLPLALTTLSVTPVNDEPVVTVTGADDVDEGDSETYSFSTVDPDSDTFSLVGDPDCGASGDYVAGSATIDPLTGAGGFDCDFPDDDPTGTDGDDTDVSVTVADDDTGEGTGTLTVTVNNVDPSVTVTGDEDLDEGTTAETYSFTVDDPGTDTFSLVGDPDCGASGDYVAGSATIDPLTGAGSFDCDFPDDDPTGTDGDDTDVSVTVADDDTGEGTGTLTVTVNNVDPSVVISGASSVNESQMLRTYSFDTTDPGLPDTFSAGTPNCGSGVFVGPITFSQATGDGSFDCRFADDNPTATASDLTSISISITDDDTGVGSDSHAVTVNNVDPSVVISGASSVNESQMLRTYSFDTTDPGLPDTFSAGTPNCGSGVFVGPITFSQATGDGSFDCRFADDNPTATASDLTSISISITDDDTGVGSDSHAVTVNNVDPSVVISGASSVNESQMLRTYSFDTTDPGLPDTFSAGTPNCGSGVFVGPITFSQATGDGSFDCRFADDNPTATASDLTSISISITDDDTGVGSDSHAVTVNNVDPSVVISGASSVNESQMLRTYSFDTTDPGLPDTFSAGTPNCGSGVFVGPITFSQATGDGSFDCRFADDNPTATASDLTSISISITDDDTGVGSDSHAVTVNNVAPVATDSDASYNAVTGDITASVTYADDGTLDGETGTFNYTWVRTSATGTPSGSATQTATGTAGSGTVSNIKHLDPGCYNITIEMFVTDDDGGVSDHLTESLSNVDLLQAAWRPPIKADERNIAKYGNVVPLKVELKSLCVPGQNVTSHNLFVTIAQGNFAPDANPDDPNVLVESVSNADTGTQMRTADSMYIYNLTTKSLVKDTEYTIRVRLGSSSGPIILKALFQPKK